jgi:hypothetical protein
MTGYFFATLVCQLANNFPNVREDVNRAICENPALLDPYKSLRDQMEALFLQPLLKLCFRLQTRAAGNMMKRKWDEGEYDEHRRLLAAECTHEGASTRCIHGPSSQG